jgi:hypothetical protein
MRKILVRRLAAALWDEFELSTEGPGRGFEQLGIPTQNAWLRIARRAVAEIRKFERIRRSSDRPARKK